MYIHLHFQVFDSNWLKFHDNRSAYTCICQIHIHAFHSFYKILDIPVNGLNNERSAHASELQLHIVILRLLRQVPLNLLKEAEHHLETLPVCKYEE
jgi:hypothetical protein